MFPVSDIFQLLLYVILLTLLAVPLGGFMFSVYTDKRTLPDLIMRPLEQLLYRAAGIDPKREMNWREYTTALVLFNLFGIVFVFFFQLLQNRLPLNPQHLGAVNPVLALNTAVSFATNTNWQAYSGESTMSYLTQRKTIPMGPVASQEAIKELGTNGGGFFNANSAHPFENPTPLTNFLEMLAILVIPAGLTFTFGHIVGDIRQGRIIFAVMLALFVIFLSLCYVSEISGSPLVRSLGVSGPYLD